MKHNFTFLVWEFVNNRSARLAYLKISYAKKPPLPPGFKMPKPEQDLALRSDSAKELNKHIRSEWSKSVVALPLVKFHPRPDWPSHP